ncbi:permease [Cohnella faecalis]|uniref:Permease n=1 Tax=Cohnella faecalis TaxID=2315694 RepID=A0A398CM90_9BACL|nr:permease [Cohnella faecalis]RIE03565.1 permease [Cohnella faecalis]
MPSSMFRWSIHLLTIGCLFMLYLIFTGQKIGSLTPLPSISADQWQSLKTVFVSIFLEALPFILLGVLVSSALNLFVSEDALRRVMPKNPVLAIVVACLFGILLPVCECGMIPIVRRLIRKGMPVYVGIAYILAAPIINPVTFFATYTAFRGQPDMAWERVAVGFAVALSLGLILYKSVKKNPLRVDAHHHHDHRDEHAHVHNHNHDHGRKGSRLLDVFTHASDEFFEMGKFLLIGAFLTAVIQTFVSRADLVDLGGGALGPHLLMMGFAYLISLCSTSDAFIASSFNGMFPKSALLTFLVFGPMLDFKNTLMMLAAFRTRFVLKLSLLIVVAVPVASIVLSRTLFHS